MESMASSLVLLPSSGRDRPRQHTRRGGGKVYILDRISTKASLERSRQQPPEIVSALVEAAKTGSALRRRLVAAAIDPKLARLVLLFYGRQEHRVADVAWMLGVSPATASRWLDRAEHDGLVDKLYHQFDRRGTWARLTTSGVAIRLRVELMLAQVCSNCD
ncbi:MAG TPA: MarR family transcriptional regulator [Acidimicrobiia bacterium]|nr:MarR family transcriptional regulator [Acidimicrobiia bacterium]